MARAGLRHRHPARHYPITGEFLDWPGRPGADRLLDARHPCRVAVAARRWLVHIALFGAAAALTKYEGLPRVGVVVLALLVEALLARCRKHVQPALALGVAAVVGYLPWLAFRWLHGIGATSEHISQIQ